MASQGSTTRPRNSDGTVNWAVVFDDPERGILAGISRATSASHLTGLIAQIAPLLFQRKNDAKALAEFTAKMNAIVDASDKSGFEATRDRLVNVMVAEKNRRIEEAEKYIANKRSSQSIERRKVSLSIGFKKAFFGTPVRLFSTLGVILILLCIGVLSQLDFSSPPPDQVASVDEGKADEQETKENAPTPSIKPSFMQKEVVYPVFMMRPVVVRSSGGRQSLVPIIVAPSIEEGSLICQLAPQFAESALFRTAAATKDSNALEPADLVGISTLLLNDTNKILKKNVVTAVYLVDTTKLGKQALRAAYRGCGMHNLKIKPEDLNR